MNVSKYKLEKDVIIKGKLLLKDEELYIQNYDPVNGKDQMIFKSDRTYLGVITDSFYWKLDKSGTIKNVTTKHNTL